MIVFSEGSYLIYVRFCTSERFIAKSWFLQKFNKCGYILLTDISNLVSIGGISNIHKLHKPFHWEAPPYVAFHWDDPCTPGLPASHCVRRGLLHLILTNGKSTLNRESIYLSIYTYIIHILYIYYTYIIHISYIYHTCTYTIIYYTCTYIIYTCTYTIHVHILYMYIYYTYIIHILYIYV